MLFADKASTLRTWAGHALSICDRLVRTLRRMRARGRRANIPLSRGPTLRDSPPLAGAPKIISEGRTRTRARNRVETADRTAERCLPSSLGERGRPDGLAQPLQCRDRAHADGLARPH